MLAPSAPTLYLAGPIAGCSYDGCVDWRDAVADGLAPDIAGLSPMRGKSYLRQEACIGDAYATTILSTQQAITARDRNDCRTAAAILFNFLGAERASLGSCIELGWGDAFGKPLILVMERDGNIHDHAMVRQVCGWRVETLEDGIAVARAILLP